MIFERRKHVKGTPHYLGFRPGGSGQNGNREAEPELGTATQPAMHRKASHNQGLYVYNTEHQVEKS